MSVYWLLWSLIVGVEVGTLIYCAVIAWILWQGKCRATYWSTQPDRFLSYENYEQIRRSRKA